MTDCSICKHAIMDYAEYYGGGNPRVWFVEDCKKCQCISADDCQEFEELEDRDG